MKKDITRIVDLWKEEVCNHIKEHVPFHASDQLKKMAAFFSPGLFYYYILNFHDLRMEYVDKNVKKVLGIAPEDFDIASLLQALPAEELRMMEKKEALAADFLFRYLSAEEILDYKVVYFLRIKDRKGNCHSILHQATTLTVSDTGKVEHVLGIHTDVSHLGTFRNDKVSFINIGEGRSYFNLDPESGVFNPDDGVFAPGDSSMNAPKLLDVLTKRELEIIKLVAMGLSSVKIAEELNLSLHTVRTHRKNILAKTSCGNTTELVTKCLVEGLV